MRKTPTRTVSETSVTWEQGQLVEVTITDLSDRGDGVGRSGQRVVFVPDTVTGDRVLVRLLHVKPQYAHGKVQELLQPSEHRLRPACIVADKCGGCQWQPVNYAYQQEAKRQLIQQALERIGKFAKPLIYPMLPRTEPLGYRNKATYPLSLSATQQVQAGYYRKGTHQVVNLNQCPIQDPRLNPLLTDVKQDLQRGVEQQGWSIYQEETHQGLLRHLSFRIGRRTGEMLLTLVTTAWHLPGIQDQAQQWLQQYPQLVGVCLNRNGDRTNTIFGSDTRCLAGRPFLQEQFAGLTLEIRSTTFFQVYTEQAEALLEKIQDELQLQGTEWIVDAYCGIGTLTLPLAKQCELVVGIEVQQEAIEQAQQNATLNNIHNVEFQVGKVEQVLPALAQKYGKKPDVVILDPPRKGCDRLVLETLRAWQPSRIVYVSCNPATLARDLKLLCEHDLYELNAVQPADFFPQTSHVECAAFLTLDPSAPVNDHLSCSSVTLMNRLK
jgi:23S rRNA (uracil1939-C5)-methyltransferase